jgi:hypothetical protein
VTNAGISRAYTTQPRRYPAQAFLYRELRQEGCLLHVFRPDAHRDGPVIRVYELGPVPAPHPQPLRLTGRSATVVRCLTGQLRSADPVSNAVIPVHAASSQPALERAPK